MSTVEAIAQDMRQAGCAPWVVDDFKRSLEHQAPALQLTFRLRTNGYTEQQIADLIGRERHTVSRYVHQLRSCLASLFDPSWS